MALTGLASLSVFLEGCITSAPWEKDYCEPNQPTALALYLSPIKRCVLVEYDEVRGKDLKIKRRAYWIRLDERPPVNLYRPKFVESPGSADLLPIPLFEPSTNIINNAPVLLAEVLPDDQVFRIHLAGAEFGPYELPVYVDTSRRFLQVVLTPIAVTADATIIGSVIFVWVWASSAANYCDY